MERWSISTDPKGRGLPKGHAANWGAGFLPSVYQGTWVRPTGDPIDNLHRPSGMSDEQQRAQLVSGGDECEVDREGGHADAHYQQCVAQEGQPGPVLDHQ